MHSLLAQEWYRDRLRPDWHPKTVPEAQAAFARIGLTGEFWRLVEAKSSA